MGQAVFCHGKRSHPVEALVRQKRLSTGRSANVSKLRGTRVWPKDADYERDERAGVLLALALVALEEECRKARTYLGVGKDAKRDRS